MSDKLNGIPVKDTVIELLQSYLAGLLSVAAQKNSTWLTHLPKVFFFFLSSEVHVNVKDFPSLKPVYNFGQTEKCQAIKHLSHGRGTL